MSRRRRRLPPHQVRKTHEMNTHCAACDVRAWPARLSAFDPCLALDQAQLQHALSTTSPCTTPLHPLTIPSGFLRYPLAMQAPSAAPVVAAAAARRRRGAAARLRCCQLMKPANHSKQWGGCCCSACWLRAGRLVVSRDQDLSSGQDRAVPCDHHRDKHVLSPLLIRVCRQVAAGAACRACKPL